MSHPTDANCIFCKIVAGQLPSFKLVEDDMTIAFMDINPVNPGHALAVAKGHWPTVDVIPPEVLAAVARTAQKVAKAAMTVLKPAGVNLVQANGPAAGATFVGHNRGGPRGLMKWSRRGRGLVAERQSVQILAARSGMIDTFGRSRGDRPLRA